MLWWWRRKVFLRFQTRESRVANAGRRYGSRGKSIGLIFFRIKPFAVNRVWRKRYLSPMQRFRFLLFIALSFDLAAQTGSVTVRATEYCFDPAGTPLANFNARVEVKPVDGSPYTIEKACAGTCVFDNLPVGSTLVFTATKHDEIKYAVNTNDLVLLSKHHNGVEPLTHPALLIAADANCDGKADTKDIVAWRRVILDLTDTSICRYWTLLDAKAVLPANPLGTPLPFEITLANYNGNDQEVNFLAIKNGNLEAAYPTLTTGVSTAAGYFDVTVQPNPTCGPLRFNLNLPESAALFLEIFDAAGKSVFAEWCDVPSGAQQMAFPATALPAQGTYVWRWSDKSGKQARGTVVRM